MALDTLCIPSFPAQAAAAHNTLNPDLAEKQKDSFLFRHKQVCEQSPYGRILQRCAAM